MYLDRQPPAVRSEFRMMIALKLGRRWLAKARRRIAKRERDEASALLAGGGDTGLLDEVTMRLPPRHQHHMGVPPLGRVAGSSARLLPKQLLENEAARAQRQEIMLLPKSYAGVAGGVGGVTTPGAVSSALLWGGLRSRAEAFEAALATGRAAGAQSAGGANGSIGVANIVSRTAYHQWALGGESRLSQSVSPRLVVAEAPPLALALGDSASDAASPAEASHSHRSVHAMSSRAMTILSARTIFGSSGGGLTGGGPGDATARTSKSTSRTALTLSADERTASLTVREVRGRGGGGGGAPRRDIKAYVACITE